MLPSARMPVLFVGHGNPLNAVEDNAYARAWSRLGASLPRPKAILSLSAHGYIESVRVTAMAKPRTLHDFVGFPPALSAVRYPASGSKELALRVQRLVEPTPAEPDVSWGLDHGTWSVLRRIFPAADVPVVQLSIDARRPPRFHYELGQKLGALRDEQVLVLGSGNVVHNLLAYARGKGDIEPFGWALHFERKVQELIAAREHAPLIDYPLLGRDAQWSVPTPDHYLPLLYVLGCQTAGDTVAFPIRGVDGGSVSMLSVQVG